MPKIIKKLKKSYILILVCILIGSLTWMISSPRRLPPVIRNLMIYKYDDVRLPFSKIKISRMNLSKKHDLIATLTFNTKTKWPDSSKMPEGREPLKILEAAKNPGLGVKELHRSGITDRGVHVAIIDQPLYLDHPEYAGKFVAYKDFGCNTEKSMHGPAVTSLLVGNEIGTAPDARVYYAAVPSWLADSAYYAKALDWIIEENRKLTGKERIRVVSVSAIPSGKGSLFTKNTKMWDESVAEAKKEGILVLDATCENGFIGPCTLDARDIDNVAVCIPGFPEMPPPTDYPEYMVLAPTSPRTTAEEYEKGDFGYQYNGRGGLSWAMPYSTGILALGWQERPELTAEDMVSILQNSAYLKDKYRIIHPSEFIKQVRAFK
ncbi:MAG: S8/S53 family peptidase [Clostridia bacterium]|nr:S8/S53 family peptidase [Clostridia bacterium]